MPKVKLIIQVDEALKQYCQGQADAFGISLNGFVNLALSQYKSQQESLKAFENMHGLIEKLEDIKKLLPGEVQK
jgi:hypothetical protein